MPSALVRLQERHTLHLVMSLVGPPHLQVAVLIMVVVVAVAVVVDAEGAGAAVVVVAAGAAAGRQMTIPPQKLSPIHSLPVANGLEGSILGLQP